MVDTMHVEMATDTPEPATELGMMQDLFFDFDTADADGDGFVSKSEFAAFRRNQSGEAPTPDASTPAISPPRLDFQGDLSERDCL